MTVARIDYPLDIVLKQQGPSHQDSWACGLASLVGPRVGQRVIPSKQTYNSSVPAVGFARRREPLKSQPSRPNAAVTSQPLLLEPQIAGIVNELFISSRSRLPGVMERLNLKPTHRRVQDYYEALRQFKTIDVSHEGAVRSAFQSLLEHCSRQFGWKLTAGGGN